MYQRIYIILLSCVLLINLGCGLTEINGGWGTSVVGAGCSQGGSAISGHGGADPSVTLGLTSTSSVNGIGSDVDLGKTGKDSITLPIGGYKLFVGYEGSVDSGISMTSLGSGALTSTIIATATAIYTGSTSPGQTSYDLLGSADINTGGYIKGKGQGAASASGEAAYDVQKLGTSSEAYGSVIGGSELKFDTRSANALLNTGGSANGLHSESRVTKTITGEIKTSGVSQIISYASAVNNARANVTSFGNAAAGAWDPSFVGTRAFQANEDVATSVTGELTGYVEANGDNDAAAVSSILQATGSKDISSTGPILAVSGGPATYASSTQSSSAKRTWAETWVKGSTWGSIVRTNKSQTVVEWGHLVEDGSGSQIFESGANATSFGKILLGTIYIGQGGSFTATGNMNLDTYADGTKGKNDVAGTIIDQAGDGTIRATDDKMFNEAGFTGGLNHFSLANPGNKPLPLAQTRAILTRAFVSTTPGGKENLSQPFFVSTQNDPIFAWSRTEGSYSQSH